MLTFWAVDRETLTQWQLADCSRERTPLRHTDNGDPSASVLPCLSRENTGFDSRPA